MQKLFFFLKKGEWANRKNRNASKLSSNHEILTFLKFPILLIENTKKAYGKSFLLHFLLLANDR